MVAVVAVERILISDHYHCIEERHETDRKKSCPTKSTERRQQIIDELPNIGSKKNLLDKPERTT